MAHDAFVSYSHAGDHRLARELERALQRLAKPWYKRRALEVFRDEGNLNLSAHLWGGIQEALDSSTFFLYLASPDAAESPWVAREIAHWRAHRDMTRLIIVLTDGELAWDRQLGDFDGRRSTAIPAVLHGAFADEPFYLDMRWARGEKTLSLDHDRFRDQIVRIAAAIRGISVEDLAGEEAEQHRRTIRIRNLAIGAPWTVFVELDQRRTIPLLADLMELVSGYRVTDLSSIVPLSDAERRERVLHLAAPEKDAPTSVDVVIRRFLDRRY